MAVDGTFLSFLALGCTEEYECGCIEYVLKDRRKMSFKNYARIIKLTKQKMKCKNNYSSLKLYHIIISFSLFYADKVGLPLLP